MTKILLKLAALLAPGHTARWAARRFLTPRPTRLDEEEVEVLATATRGEMVGGSGPRVHAYVWGEGGPTVLLVHGWNGNVGQMTPFVPPLRRLGFRVVSFSAPAHGASEGAATHVPQIAQAVSAVARRFGPLHAIVAHSIGATAAARAVEGGLPVGRLAFVAPATRPGAWIEGFASAEGLVRIQHRLAAAVEELAGARLADLELAAMAPALDVPVLALHDRSDPLASCAEARRATSRMPIARLVETSGLGHFRILREPAVVRAVASFVLAGASPEAAPTASRTEVPRLGSAA